MFRFFNVREKHAYIRYFKFLLLIFSRVFHLKKTARRNSSQKYVLVQCMLFFTDGASKTSKIQGHAMDQSCGTKHDWFC